MIRLGFFMLVAFALTAPVFAGVGVSTDAKRRGEYGLRAEIDGTSTVIRNDSVAGAGQLQARFYARLNSFEADEQASTILFSAVDASESRVLEVRAVRFGESWRLGLAVLLDSGLYEELSAESGPELPDGWFALEVRWVAGNGNGLLEYWLNDEAQAPFSALLNGATEPAAVELGLIAVAEGSSGFVDFDDIEVRQEGRVGVICFPRTALVGPSAEWPLAHDVRHMVELLAEACE